VCYSPTNIPNHKIYSFSKQNMVHSAATYTVAPVEQMRTTSQ
jgi:hypothetical protein